MGGRPADIVRAKAVAPEDDRTAARNSLLGFRGGLAGGMKDGVLKWAHGPSFEEGGIGFRLWAPKKSRSR